MKLKTNCKPLQMGSPQGQTDKNSPVSREFRGYGSPFFCFWWWAWGVYTGREGFVLFFFFLVFFYTLLLVLTRRVFLLPSTGNWWICKLDWAWNGEEGHLAWMCKQVPFPPEGPGVSSSSWLAGQSAAPAECVPQTPLPTLAHRSPQQTLSDQVNE